MNHDRAGIIIIKDGQILLMQRIKPGKLYYGVPGGHIEPGETPAETAVRELKEETSLDVELGELFMELENQDRKETYFLAKSFSGTPVLGGEEAERNCLENQYKIMWVKLKNLKDLELYPTILKEKLIALL